MRVRVAKAAKLYHQGIAAVILCSAGEAVDNPKPA